MIRGMLGALVAFTLAVLLAAPARAATPAPPFTQCPPVGADSSCALLIYIDSSGSVGVLGDPSQGPYDSVEDTLIGVQNDSRSSIASIPVSATSGKDLFGFDGDGLCTYLTDPGCPFGPSGYEGPGVSFGNVSADFTSGTVTFSPAIPPGGHAYFSLEEALATVPPFDIDPGPPAPADIHMVSLGDSYSSGEGTFNYDNNKGAQLCHRGPDAWPRLLQQDAIGIPTIRHVACTGAKTADLTEDYKGNPPQIRSPRVRHTFSCSAHERLAIASRRSWSSAKCSPCAMIPNCSSSSKRVPTTTTVRLPLSSAEKGCGAPTCSRSRFPTGRA